MHAERRQTRFLVSWIALLLMLAFSAHAIWTQLDGTAPIPQGPRATVLALMARALGSREAALDMTATLDALAPNSAVVFVSSDQSWDATLLRYVVRYVTWPREMSSVDCSAPHAQAMAPAGSLVVLANSDRVSLEGDRRPIGTAVSVVNVAAGPQPLACP
jgi:hypothetical protein